MSSISQNYTVNTNYYLNCYSRKQGHILATNFSVDDFYIHDRTGGIDK